MLKRILFLSLSFLFNTIYATNPIPKNGITGNFDLGLSFTKNTETTLQFNNLFLIKYQLGNSSFSLTNNISFISKSGEDEILNKGTQDFRYALNSKKIDINITLNHMYDISRSIKHRYGSGLGMSYNPHDTDTKKLGFGISALKEKEINLTNDPKIQNRLSGNIIFMIKPNKNFSISGTTNYQPNIEETGDFRWNSNISFRVNLNPHFLLSINNTFNYDSMPEEGVSKSDYQLINSVSYNF